MGQVTAEEIMSANTASSVEPVRMPNFAELRQRARVAANEGAGCELDYDRRDWHVPPRFAEHGMCARLREPHRCGGGFGMPAVTNARGAKRGKKQAVPMPGDGLLAFPGDILHGTFDHAPVGAGGCKAGCKAHISMVTQLEGDTLALTEEQIAALTHDARVIARHDVLNCPVWRDALWVECEHDEAATAARAAPGYLGLPGQEWEMHTHSKVVCWVKGLPIMLYNAHGAREAAQGAREHFEVLADVPDSFWTLRRTADNLGIDGVGRDKPRRQRMWMAGIRKSQRRNAASARPSRVRPKLLCHILNKEGDLDTYAENYDKYDFLYQRARPIYQNFACSIAGHMPCGAAFKAALAAAVDLEARAFTDLHAGYFLSDDRLVSNLGISSRYPAPAHRDRQDVGFTCAVSCKCGVRRKPGSGADKELAQLFATKQTSWGLG